MPTLICLATSDLTIFLEAVYWIKVLPLQPTAVHVVGKISTSDAATIEIAFNDIKSMESFRRDIAGMIVSGNKPSYTVDLKLCTRRATMIHINRGGCSEPAMTAPVAAEPEPQRQQATVTTN